MRAVSLFSGAGGMDRGFDLAGIQTVLQAENDPWCLEVLARHWPDVERVTDVREVGALTHRNSWSRADNGGRDGARHTVDLVYGGFPCQDVSVAGNRAGLGGERSGLWSEFARIVSELRPRWVCIENVPGLLSSAGGRDFGTILSDLDDIGYGVAWAVLDARYFGIPQRRRRVFLVGCLGNPDAAAAVLAVCESCGGHPAPSRETGQGIADCITGGSLGTRSHSKPSGRGRDNNLVAASLSAGGHPGSNMPGRHHEDDVNLVIEPEARAVRARASGYRMDGETENFVVGALRQNVSGDVFESEEMPPLRAGATGGMNQPTIMVAGALRASDGHHGHSSPRGDGSDNLIAFDYLSTGTHRTDIVRRGGYSGSLGAQRTHEAISDSAGVRRLTPLECSRLMAWPDDWLRWTVDGREIPDSHQYRMAGNGVVSTVAQWIGLRMVAVNRMLA